MSNEAEGMIVAIGDGQVNGGEAVQTGRNGGAENFRPTNTRFMLSREITRTPEQIRRDRLRNVHHSIRGLFNLYHLISQGGQDLLPDLMADGSNPDPDELDSLVSKDDWLGVLFWVRTISGAGFELPVPKDLSNIPVDYMDIYGRLLDYYKRNVLINSKLPDSILYHELIDLRWEDLDHAKFFRLHRKPGSVHLEIGIRERGDPLPNERWFIPPLRQLWINPESGFKKPPRQFTIEIVDLLLSKAPYCLNLYVQSLLQLASVEAGLEYLQAYRAQFQPQISDLTGRFKGYDFNYLPNDGLRVEENGSYSYTPGDPLGESEEVIFCNETVRSAVKEYRGRFGKPLIFAPRLVQEDPLWEIVQEFGQIEICNENVDLVFGSWERCRQILDFNSFLYPFGVEDVKSRFWDPLLKLPDEEQILIWGYRDPVPVPTQDTLRGLWMQSFPEETARQMAIAFQRFDIMTKFRFMDEMMELTERILLNEELKLMPRVRSDLSDGEDEMNESQTTEPQVRESERSEGVRESERSDCEKSVDEP